MQPNETVTVGQLAGDFTLPSDQTKELILIAGGIGITPFISMLKYAIDTNQARKTTLFYLVGDETEVAYKDVLTKAVNLGYKIVPMTTRLTAQIIAKEVPNYKSTVCYISGPDAMVANYKSLLKTIGVHRVKTDYFSGY